jgi:Cys-tRNA(Pro) deacylase
MELGKRRAWRTILRCVPDGGNISVSLHDSPGNGRNGRRSLILGGVSKGPSTPATRLLRDREVPFTEHVYRYEEHGGTDLSARALGVDEHVVVKTLVVEDDERRPLIVLMHGDREVSLKKLARAIGKKSVEMCEPRTAQRHSGYAVGGTSPFGTKQRMPVYIERSVLELDHIYVNGGARGFLVRIAPADLVRLLAPTSVEVAI